MGKFSKMFEKKLIKKKLTTTNVMTFTQKIVQIDIRYNTTDKNLGGQKRFLILLKKKKKSIHKL